MGKRTCTMCGAEYDYCPSCPGQDPAWKMSFCSENCRTIYHICAGYAMGDIPIAEAAKKIAECDLTEKSKFSSSTRRILGELTNYTPPAATTAATVTNAVSVKKDFRKKK